MFRRKRLTLRLTLGDGLLLALFAFGYFALILLLQTNLLWHGVTTRGVIVDEQGIICYYGRTGRTTTERQSFSVQFTDHTGQVYISTISQCDYSNFRASPGDSVAIVYLNPTKITPHDELLTDVQFNLIGAILSGLITLFLLSLWIGKRTRMASLQDQPEQNATMTDDVKDQEGTEDYRPTLDRDIIGGPTPGDP